MDLVLAGFQWSDYLVHLDDAIVLGRTFDGHLCNLGSVLQRLRESGLRLCCQNALFFQREVQYLYIISSDGAATKVATWPILTSTRETRQFIGIARY